MYIKECMNVYNVSPFDLLQFPQMVSEIQFVEWTQSSGHHIFYFSRYQWGKGMTRINKRQEQFQNLI